jgi:hypothetical protein
LSPSWVFKDQKFFRGPGGDFSKKPPGCRRYEIRGALFEKAAPHHPLQKLLLNLFKKRGVINIHLIDNYTGFGYSFIFK